MPAVEPGLEIRASDHGFGYNVLVLLSLSLLATLPVLFVACICCYTRGEPDSDSEGSSEGEDETDVGGFAADRIRLLKQKTEQVLSANNNNLNKEIVSDINIDRPGVSLPRLAADGAQLTVKGVQPDTFAQWSLSKSLGLTSTESLPTTSRLAESPALTNRLLVLPPLFSASAVSLPAGLTSPESSFENLQYRSATPSLPLSPLCPSMEPPTPGPLGHIKVHLQYNVDKTTLTLLLMGATNLPAKDFSGTSDPYVKILLLPDRKHKLLSNIKRKSLNPQWNETFAFEGYPYKKLKTKTLYLQVLDYDRFSRDDPIGETYIRLEEVDLAHGETLTKSLLPCCGNAGKLGEILLSLWYKQSSNTIAVEVIRARDLKAKDINGYSDPYVKIWLICDGKKVEKRKTRTQEKTLNPVYNETLVFNVTYEKIRTASLQVTVMDYDRFSPNELIGQVVLGNRSGPVEVKHWKEMFSKSKQTVPKWHILRDMG